MNIGGVFQRITTALDSAGIEYMLAGSFASTRYGSPRSTQDIDIVISAGPEQLKSLIQDLTGSTITLNLTTRFMHIRMNPCLTSSISKQAGRLLLFFASPRHLAWKSSDAVAESNCTDFPYLLPALRTLSSRSSRGRKTGLLIAKLKTLRLS